MIVCLYVLMGILVGWLGDDCYCDFGLLQRYESVICPRFSSLLKNQLVGGPLRWTDCNGENNGR